MKAIQNNVIFMQMKPMHQVLTLCGCMCVGDREIEGEGEITNSAEPLPSVWLARHDEIRMKSLVHLDQPTYILWACRRSFSAAEFCSSRCKCQGKKKHTIWLNEWLHMLHTWGLISQDTQDKAKGSGDLVAKQLLLIQTLFFYSYDESCIKAWQLMKRQRDARSFLT